MRDVRLEDGVEDEEAWRSSFAFVVGHLIVLAHPHVIVLFRRPCHCHSVTLPSIPKDNDSHGDDGHYLASLTDLVVCTASAARTASNKGIRVVVGKRSS